jgi:multiple sugar transport system permease protein
MTVLRAEQKAMGAPHKHQRKVSLMEFLAGPRAAPWLFISGATLLTLVFRLLPAVAGLALSFFRYNAVRPPQFIGLRNYSRMFEDVFFIKGLTVTGYYVVGTVAPAVILGFALALLLNQRWMPLRGFFRVVYFLPTVVSMAAIAYVWQWMLNPSFGLVNILFRELGLPPQQFLGDPKQVMPTIIVIVVWKVVGYFMVIFLAGLQSIPRELYEAAQIDGAGRWTELRHITIPLSAPTILFATVIAIIGGWQVFDIVYILTGGGPVNASRVIVYHIWYSAFFNLELGYASAMAVTLFLIIAVFTYLQFRIAGDRGSFF